MRATSIEPLDGAELHMGKEQRVTIVQRMREKLRESMKARDAVQTQFLHYWIAGLTPIPFNGA